MIKVLYFIPGFSFGGIETVFKNNFNNIDNKKIQMMVMVEKELASKSSIEDLQKMGCKVYIIPLYLV